ncbi:restriction endonuclease subunit S [Helicobacter zhangjianzhongii]|uniref:restriction endonuclease subunit S n=1 Tax=Helicobacter zhangjianzhongii TaxID=2974574 RepID=UPI0025526A1C|nr:restriction endonuclease subunit S [Helicobacter sp. CPD2-1]MDL0079565.1 restriction endonuclease subunit S [Helicobacter sp. CPD2-1]
MEGNALSPRLRELEKDFKQNGGKWKSFKIGELFEINTPKKKFNANAIKFNGKYPYVARGDSNNGIRGYIDEDEAFLNEANTISFGQDTATIFYQTSPYFTGDKIKIFTFKKGELDRYKANFLISVMKKAFINFSWGSSSFNVGNLKNVCVLLPVLPTACHTDLERSEREVSQNIESKKDFSPTAQNDKNTKSNFKAQTKPTMQGYKIAFNYMESYIKELEAERLQELEAYLKVTGLNDYTLSQKEKDALKAFENLSTPKRERERERE